METFFLFLGGLIAFGLLSGFTALIWIMVLQLWQELN